MNEAEAYPGQRMIRDTTTMLRRLNDQLQTEQRWSTGWRRVLVVGAQCMWNGYCWGIGFCIAWVMWGWLRS